MTRSLRGLPQSRGRDVSDMPVLDALFDADIASGQDSIGVAPRRTEEGIRFFFPISIVAWDR